MSELPTPETDKAERMAFASEYMVPTEFARELERQRDEAYQKQNETYRSSKYACDYHHELKINAEKERDEARNECDKIKQLLLAADSDVDAYLGVCMERDEARERLAKITIAAEAVIDRWEQPAWKDTEPTGTVIYRLRDALGREAK